MVWQELVGDPNDPRSPSVSKYFEALEKLEFDGVLSDLVVLEAVAAWKFKRTEKIDSPAPKQKVELFEQQVRELANGLDLPILSMSDVLSRSKEDKLQRALEIVKETKPHKPRKKWKTVGSNDALHVALAENHGATHFATLDQGFEKFRGRVNVLFVHEVY